MTIFTRVYGDTTDRVGAASALATYADARNATTATIGAASANTILGQSTASASSWTIRQAFLSFNTTGAPSGYGAILSVRSSAPSTNRDFIEVVDAMSTGMGNKIAGGSIGTPLGSAAFPTALGRVSIQLSASPAISTAQLYLLCSQNERLNVPPIGAAESGTIDLADQTGTTNDPYLDIPAGAVWDYVGTGTSVEATATSHILTEPAGVAAGDLLVACIGSRIASTTQITLPSGWTRVGQQLNNNTLATTAALPSGMMAYIIRGASAPALTFTHPVAPNVALGRIVAYRNVHPTTPLDTGVTQATTATVITAVSVAGLTTTADDDLIVALCAGGQEGTWSSFNATDPGIGSGTTSASVLDPIWGQWLERSDIQTVTGNDMSLAVFDAVKQTAGATGNLVATTTLQAGHVVIAGSFKLAPPAPTGTTYNDTVAETAAAAETSTATVLVQSYVRETEAADWRETEDGTIRITEGDFFVAPPIEAAVAESASAADTVTAARAYTCAVAENAGANETIGITLLRIGAVAESAAAADTATGLLTRIGAVAETASAAETTDASIVPAAGIFDKVVVETAPVVDTTDALVVGTRAIAETASAAETINKALSLTGAVTETTTAADTVAGLRVGVSAIVETASAVETINGLLIGPAAVAESAAAVETITYSLTGAAGTTYNEVQAEVAVAVDSLTGRLGALGAIAESASAAETTTRLVSYTKAIIETAAAVDTVAGLRVIAGTIAETAAAAETTTANLLGVSAAIAETAAAAETIGATVIALPQIIDVTLAESASAADTVTVDIRRWIRESPPPWTNWVEEATAAAGWTRTAHASASWMREDAELGDWIVETQPTNRWTKE